MRTPRPARSARGRRSRPCRPPARPGAAPSRRPARGRARAGRSTSSRAGSSQADQAGRGSISGIRWCTAASWPSAAVVTIELVSSRSGPQISYRPANASTSPERGVRYVGCRPAPSGRGAHSYQPSAGTRQRRRRTAERNAGSSVTVSARALISFAARLGVRAQDGTRPHFAAPQLADHAGRRGRPSGAAARPPGRVGRRDVVVRPAAPRPVASSASNSAARPARSRLATYRPHMRNTVRSRCGRMVAMTAPWPAPRATSPVDAEVSVPGSKSVTNRALILAALAGEPSRLRDPLRARDTTLMAAALQHARRRRRRRRRGLGRHPRPRCAAAAASTSAWPAPCSGSSRRWPRSAPARSASTATRGPGTARWPR